MDDFFEPWEEKHFSVVSIFKDEDVNIDGKGQYHVSDVHILFRIECVDEVALQAMFP